MAFEGAGQVKVFSANTGFLWPALPFPERILQAARQGFGAIEFHDEAQSNDLGLIEDRLAQAGLPLLGLNTHMAQTMGCAAIPGQDAAAQADFEAALAVAEHLNARAIHVLSGRTDAPDRLDVLARALKRFSDQTDKLLLIEPLAPVAVAGYALGTIHDAAQVVSQVGADNVKIMFDSFHIDATEAELSATYMRYKDQIGHVQIAACGHRGAPHQDARIREFVSGIDCTYIGCEWRDDMSDAICPDW